MLEEKVVWMMTPLVSEDTTSHEEWKLDDPVYNYFLILVSSLIIITNLMTIFAVLLVVFKKKPYNPTSHQRNSYILIFNLAIADISVGLSSLLLLNKYGIYYNEQRTYSLCLLKVCLIIVPCSASVFSMTAISLDRYVSIMLPFRYDYIMEKRKVLLIIGLIWAVSLLIGFAPLMGWNKGTYEFELHQRMCLLLLLIPASYVVFGLLGVFLPQLVLIIYIGVKIFKVSKKHRKQIKNIQVKKTFVINMFNKQLAKKEVLTTHSCPVSPVMPRIDTGYDEEQAFFLRAVPFDLNQKDINSIQSMRKGSMPILSLHGNSYKMCHRKLTSQAPNLSSLETFTSFSYVSKPTLSKKISDNEKTHSPKRRVSFSCGISRNSLASNFRTHFKRTAESSKTIKSNLEALRKITLVISFFFIMWSPFLITSCVQYVCGESCQLHVVVVTYLLLLGLCNSAINPVIYTYTNMELKTEICSPCVKCKQRKIWHKSPSSKGKRSAAEVYIHSV